MIKFDRDGTKVKIRVTHGVFSTNEIWAYWECSNDLFAQLLTDQLREQVFNEIKRIRREEYNRGWKDAKSKKTPKRDWFPGSFS